MPTTQGGGVNQIIVVPAGLPGQANAVFSSLQTVTCTTGNANTVIPDVGFLMVMPLAANVSLQFQDPANTWTAIMGAGGSIAQVFFSDATNLRFHSADTSTNRNGTYYVFS